MSEGLAVENSQHFFAGSAEQESGADWRAVVEFPPPRSSAHSRGTVSPPAFCGSILLSKSLRFKERKQANADGYDNKHEDRKSQIVVVQRVDTHKAELPRIIHSRQSNEQAVNPGENNATSQV